jgi:hypothetical protein
MKTQTNALNRTSNSTWSLSFLNVKTVYNAIVRLSMTYAVSAWYAFTATKKNSLLEDFQRVQNKAMRSVTEVFKIIFIITLHLEIEISSLNLFLDVKVTKYRQCLWQLRVEQKIDQACRLIRAKLLTRKAHRSLNHMLHSKSIETN